MQIILPEGIDKEVLQGLRAAQLDRETVGEIHKEILVNYQNKAKGYRTAVYILQVMMLLFTGMSLSIGAMGKGVQAFLVVFLLLNDIGMVLILRHFYRDRLKRQFLKAIQTSYPLLHSAFMMDYHNARP